jgi:hypothetical protein
MVDVQRLRAELAEAVKAGDEKSAAELTVLLNKQVEKETR